MGLVIILILAGLLLLLAEIFLIPGIGVAGFLGIASLVGSSYLSFVQLGRTAGIIVTVIDVALVVALIAVFLRAKTWSKAELKEAIDTKTVPVVKVSVGEKGRTTTRLAPMGTARIGDKGVEVTSVEGMIDPETDIEVVRVENNKIYVKKTVN